MGIKFLEKTSRPRVAHAQRCSQGHPSPTLLFFFPCPHPCKLPLLWTPMPHAITGTRDRSYGSKREIKLVTLKWQKIGLKYQSVREFRGRNIKFCHLYRIINQGYTVGKELVFEHRFNWMRNRRVLKNLALFCPQTCPSNLSNLQIRVRDESPEYRYLETPKPWNSHSHNTTSNSNRYYLDTEITRLWHCRCCRQHAHCTQTLRTPRGEICWHT